MLAFWLLFVVGCGGGGGDVVFVFVLLLFWFSLCVRDSALSCCIMIDGRCISSSPMAST